MRLLTFLITGFILAAANVHALQVQAHRGNRGGYCENSIPAFLSAMELGVDFIELDIHLTADKKIVILHDATINNTLYTYKDGNEIENDLFVYDLTLNEIKQIDCGRKTNPKFPDQQSLPNTPIPTLQEVFDLLPSYAKTGINIEMKRDGRSVDCRAPPREFAKLLIAEVRKNRVADRVYYSSFDPELLAEVRKLDPAAKIGFLYNTRDLILDKVIEIASSFNAQIISPEHVLLSKELVTTLKSVGFQVIPWVINDPKRWSELIEMGVDGIITDYPEELLHFIAN